MKRLTDSERQREFAYPTDDHLVLYIEVPEENTYLYHYAAEICKGYETGRDLFDTQSSTSSSDKDEKDEEEEEKTAKGASVFPDERPSTDSDEEEEEDEDEDEDEKAEEIEGMD